MDERSTPSIRGAGHGVGGSVANASIMRRFRRQIPSALDLIGENMRAMILETPLWHSRMQGSLLPGIAQ